MMMATLEIHLGHQHASARVTSTAAGWRRWLGPSCVPPKENTPAVSVPTEGRPVMEVLEALALETDAHSSTRASELAVQVGMQAAKVALMRLEVPVRQVDERALVHAWTRQMWGLSSATHVIRWRKVRQGNALVVSATDADLFAELESLGRSRNLRFVSCRPASARALDSLTTSECVRVWTEASGDGRRFAGLQFVRAVGAEPQNIWRGWAPRGDGTRDDSLHGALDRFRGALQISRDVPIEHLHWDRGDITFERLA
jgi:hypothetical protein